jgi:c-di-GMP phosphodiesterase
MNMSDQPVLAQLAISHCPIFDAQRAMLGTRLTLSPWRAGAAAPAGQALLQALAQVWPSAAQPAKPGNSFIPGTVGLNVVGEDLLKALLQAPPLSPFAIEVPAFLLTDAAMQQRVRDWHGAGGQLWIKGGGATTLDADLKACFRHVVYDAPEAPPSGRGAWSAIAAGVQECDQLDAALRQGALAGAGWPLRSAPAAGVAGKKVAPEMQVVLELIGRVDREEPIERLEATLKADPSLAFRLLRYMNSAAFGLQVEVSSFRHALAMLGYARLKRWLALLLASASKDVKLKPVMHAAVRRGLVMEELARGSGDAEMKSEMFICGVFSLLDAMLGQPMNELLPNVPLPERVRQALGAEAGPFAPYLVLVKALESGDPYAQQESAEALMLDAADLNRALLAALLAARLLD